MVAAVYESVLLLLDREWPLEDHFFFLSFSPLKSLTMNLLRCAEIGLSGPSRNT